QGGKDSNDCNDHQQLEQGEGVFRCNVSVSAHGILDSAGRSHSRGRTIHLVAPRGRTIRKSATLLKSDGMLLNHKGAEQRSRNQSESGKKMEAKKYEPASELEANELTGKII